MKPIEGPERKVVTPLGQRTNHEKPEVTNTWPPVCPYGSVAEMFPGLIDNGLSSEEVAKHWGRAGNRRKDS